MMLDRAKSGRILSESVVRGNKNDLKDTIAYIGYSRSAFITLFSQRFRSIIRMKPWP